MNKKLKTIFNSILFLGLGIVLFIWAVSKVGLDSIVVDIKAAHFHWILLAMVCGVLSHIARALRWNLLLHPMGYKASNIASFHAVIIGYLVNLAIPRLGEVTRPAVLNKMENIPFNKLVGTVLAERIIDMIITLLIALCIVLIQFQIISEYLILFMDKLNLRSFTLYILIALVVVITLYLLYRFREKIYALPIFQRFRSFTEGLLDGLKTILRLKHKGLFLFYSLFIWLMYFCMPYFVLFSLDATAHLGVSAGLTVLLFGTAAIIIPVPGGIGTFHVLVPAALALYEIGSVAANSYAVLTHAIQVLLILIVGLFSLIYFVIKSQALKKKNAVEKTHQ